MVAFVGCTDTQDSGAGIDVSALTYAPDGVDENTRKVAIESAINAVKTPYEVTPSQYVGSSQTI